MDTDLVRRFLETAYQHDDWLAVFLKSYETGGALQRVRPLAVIVTEPFQRWLRARNAAFWNVYISVNAIKPGRRSRTRDAIAAIRHVFVDIDGDGAAGLQRLTARRDLPPPSYILHSSPGRVHVFWRARDFTSDRVEDLQRQLARELGADPAATPCTQTTRVPGFRNQKYPSVPVVTIEYRDAEATWAPADFPQPMAPARRATVAPVVSGQALVSNVAERVERYLAATPPAIAGQHGDLHTFRVCCRLVRGFALDDAQALAALTAWNRRCEPPWTEHDLRDKLRRARRYGREPIGGMLSCTPLRSLGQNEISSPRARLQGRASVPRSSSSSTRRTFSPSSISDPGR
jgi:hypothetical protein